jgi:sigma-B regulation protein RsbU (phosphoserine phosphatase)
MNKKIFLSITLFLFFTIALFAVKSNLETISLNKNWSYAVETNIKKITSFDMKPNENQFKPIPFLQLSQLQNLVPNKIGVIWLKVDFLIPSEFSQEDLSCNFGQISMQDQTWLNGVYIGGWGSFEKDSWNYWNKPREYTIPSFLIHSGSTNTIYLRVYVDQKGFLCTTPTIAKSHTIHEKVINENFVNSTSYMLLAAILLMIGFYNIFSFLQRKNGHINLTYAVICFLSVIYTSKFYILELPGLQSPQIPFFLFEQIVSTSLIFILLFLVCDFFNEIFKRTSAAIVYIIRFIFLIIPLIIIFTAKDYSTLNSRSLILSLFTLPSIGYLIYIFVCAIYHNNKKIMLVLWSFSPLFFTIIFDIITHAIFHLFCFPYLSNWGWQIVIIIQFFILASEITNENTQLEKTISELEISLHEKFREISMAKDSLMTANKYITSEKEQKEHDKNTAAFVQKCSSIDKVPKLKKWEVAYCYKPQQAISSIIYDFFINNNELHGIELFALSKHSLSSALIAMLAKNNIQSCFYNGSNLPLHKIMQQINKNIANKKIAFPTHITGILLRIKDNRIEYVNAGHPDILHKSGKTGKVRPVKIENKDIQGPALGSAKVDDEYTSVAFSMKQNDILFMYTNCLIESKNAENEKFGVERLSKVLSECTSKLPDEYLQTIEEKLRLFCGKEPLCDDLTMLLIQKKSELN